ncbi:hypothetical protein [Microbacterium sp. NPDC055521]
MSFDRPSRAHDDASADESRLRADARAEAGIGSDEIDPDDDGVLYEDQVQPEYGILGFTLRELIIIGAWLVGFVASFFPVGPVGDTVWTSGIHWILMMGVPTAAVFLVVLRRFSPDGIRRVGSLGIDQFASVAAAVAAVSWAQVLWQQVAATVETGVLLIGWVAVVGQLATLVLVAATVFAPVLPRLRDDFHGRLETLAHRNANPVRPVIARPRAERQFVPPAGESAGAAPLAERGDSAAAPQPVAAEPRVDTALTMVIPDATAVPDARDRAPGSDHRFAPDARDAESASPEVAPYAPYERDQQPLEPQPVESQSAEVQPVEVQPVEVQPVDMVAASDASAAPAPETAAPEVTAPEVTAMEVTAPEVTAPETERVSYEPAPTSEPDPDASDALPVAPDHRDDDSEVLYNTAAVEALQSIFADDAADPSRSVEHNTAPDGLTGPVAGAAGDDQPLRRTRSEESAETHPYGQPEPFWILAPTERDVLDERGQPLFRIGPTAWALAIEDRGGAFVVRHEDGRIGYLHDILDITKG